MQKIRKNLLAGFGFLTFFVTSANADVLYQAYTDLVPLKPLSTRELLQVFSDQANLVNQILAPKLVERDQKIASYKAEIARIRAELNGKLTKCGTDASCAKGVATRASIEIQVQERNIVAAESSYETARYNENANARQGQLRGLMYHGMLRLLADSKVRMTQGQTIIQPTFVFHADEASRDAYCKASPQPLVNPQYCGSPVTNDLHNAFVYWSRIHSDQYIEEIAFFDTNFWYHLEGPTYKKLEAVSEAQLDALFKTVVDKFDAYTTCQASRYVSDEACAQTVQKAQRI
ncbi:MAG: hypothetical protein JNL01_01775 [Bdellovibrionales bacterium]|nr:hypothetical protein [Bdellovibrionales bacterium]